MQWCDRRWRIPVVARFLVFFSGFRTSSQRSSVFVLSSQLPSNEFLRSTDLSLPYRASRVALAWKREDSGKIWENVEKYEKLPNRFWEFLIPSLEFVHDKMCSLRDTVAWDVVWWTALLWDYTRWDLMRFVDEMFWGPLIRFEARVFVWVYYCHCSSFIYFFSVFPQLDCSLLTWERRLTRSQMTKRRGHKSYQEIGGVCWGC